jgi:hypothetical protein
MLCTAITTNLIYYNHLFGNMTKRTISIAILVVTISLVLVTAININTVTAQSSAPRVNWGGLCRNPIVDAVVAEPCETLTTPDGYTLTPDGQRVAKCIAGGGLLLLVDPSGQALAGAQALGPAVGCGASTGTTSSANSNNLLTGILGLLTR